MKISLRLLTALCLIALVSIPICSKASDLDEIPPPPIEWGKISKADFDVKSFAKDTNASVIILCDYGDIRVNDDIGMTLNRHLRIKILNTKGFAWGTHTVDLYDDKDDGDIIDDIEAVTYVLDNGGVIVEHEMDDDEVFMEKVQKDHARCKFTVPSLQPGCIIEFRYKVRSKSLWGIRAWVFQHDEPVVWSEYRLLHPSSIAFVAVTRGYEQFTVKEETHPSTFYSGAAASYFGSNILKCSLKRWAMKDIPALRDEPYITTIDDYCSKVDVQLAAFALRTGGVERVLNTWEGLIKELRDSKYIGDRITTSGDVEDLSQTLTAHCASSIEKMKVLYSWVTNSIVWNGEQSIYSEQTPNELLKSKKGNSADINYILVSLLRSAGVSCDQMILSTRGHGLLQDLYPITKQFNLGMAVATIDGVKYFLDATDPFRAYTLVPSKILGVRALIINEEPTPEWVTVRSAAKSASTILASVTLDTNGSLAGTIDGMFKDYSNINLREKLKENKPSEAAKEFFSLDGSMVNIDSVDVINKDSVDKPIRLKTTVSSDAFAQAGGELMYVNPQIINPWKDNPFKSATRKFPVDYNYPREFTAIVKFVIPDSFEVKEALHDKFLSVNNEAAYSRRSAIEENRIEIVTKFEILSSVIAASNYQQLKEFYSAMIQTEAEQIVLQKKRGPAATPAPEPASQTAAQPKRPAIKKK